MKSRPIVAATPTSSRAGSDSCASRDSMTACTLGLRPPAAGPTGAHRLDHEQRIAFGLAPELIGLGTRQDTESLRKRSGVRPGQPGEFDLGQPIEGPQATEQVGQRRLRLRSPPSAR